MPRYFLNSCLKGYHGQAIAPQATSRHVIASIGNQTRFEAINDHRVVKL